MFLKELTELNGVSGNEDDVREYIKNKALTISQNVSVDRIGNVIVYKKGKNSKCKVLLSAHMDEVGLIVTAFTEGGMLRFRAVGGIDERILPGKNVLIGKDKIKGVIGVKPIHLQKGEQRNLNIKINDMYIDIGADKKEEAEKLTKLGDYISFYSLYEEMGINCIKAKALDDRVGCAILLETLGYDYDFDLYASFTVSEEIGLRGSEVAAYEINPDLAFVIEGTTCQDTPNAKEYEYTTQFGKGPAITIMDNTSYSDRNLVNYIIRVAEKNKINVQFKSYIAGGNDAGKIQTSRSGISVASISVPCRYIHSPSSMINIKDYDDTKRLVKAILDDI